MDRSKRILYGQDERVVKWVEKGLGMQLGSSPYVGIGLEQEELIGGIAYTNYSGGGSIALSIYGAYPGWITRGFIRAGFAYPFIQLSVRRVSAYVACTNVRSQRFVESLGFELESIMERAIPDDDVRVYRMFKENCRWLHG